MQKVVLITGCSSGIGYHTALKFARNGHKTFATVRNLNSGGAVNLKKISEDEDLPLKLYQLDVTKDQSVARAVKSVITSKLNKEGKIDILVNNAGFGYLGPIEDFTIDEIKDQYETNIFGVLRVAKAVAPYMRKQKLGLIINISSINGLIPFPLFSVYSSSKFAIETLSEGLRFELSHFGIKVVIVEPGSFLTKFVDNRKHPKAFMTAESAYNDLTSNFFARYNKTHDKAKVTLLNKTLNPSRVVDTIYHISELKKPSPRYLVGYDAWLFYTLRKLLPWQIWEFLLKKAYKW